jgi:hypothetical protein
MSQNLIPQDVSPVAGRTREELKLIAEAQRRMLVFLLIYVCSAMVRLALGQKFPPIANLGLLAVAIATAIFVFMLAIKLYGTGVGVLLGILTLIPLVGLFILLIVNGKATKILRENGLKVGFMGVKLSEFDAKP